MPTNVPLSIKDKAIEIIQFWTDIPSAPITTSCVNVIFAFRKNILADLRDIVSVFCWQKIYFQFDKQLLFKFSMIINGKAPGNHMVQGISPGNTINKIFFIFFDAIPPAIKSIDLTSEFTITAPNTINNTGGTDTTNGVLVISWIPS